MITKPKGTYDIYGENAKYYNYINGVFASVCEYYNYEYIRTPIFEESELFHRSVENHLTLYQKKHMILKIEEKEI